MNKDNNLILNRFFTQNIFWDLINNNESSLFESCVRRYINEVSNIKNNDLIREVYKYLNKRYRNEYFYKNTLLNKLLIGRHSVKTTTALTEVPINKSKADFILINGKAVVYEIKTGLDTFERLEHQINDYYKAFNHVCVVTCESNYDKLNQLLKNSDVGICILTNRNTISTRKEPQMNNASLDYSTMFKVLRKSEFENILLNYYGSLPNTRQVNYYKECYKLFSAIEMNTVYKLFIKELKNRSKIEVDEYKKVPYELKFLVYFSNFTKKDYTKLFDFLNDQWRR